MEVANKQPGWVFKFKNRGEINMGHYITGLKKSIKTKNISQAKAFIEQIASKDENEKLEVIQLLALAPDTEALEQLSF